MKKISYDYSVVITSLDDCEESGTTSMKVTDAEARALKENLAAAKKSGDILAYFGEHLSDELNSIIKKKTSDSIERELACDSLALGSEALGEDITDEEIDSMTEEELIDRIIDVNQPLEELVYKITDMKIVGME